MTERRVLRCGQSWESSSFLPLPRPFREHPCFESHRPNLPLSLIFQTYARDAWLSGSWSKGKVAPDLAPPYFSPSLSLSLSLCLSSNAQLTLKGEIEAPGAPTTTARRARQRSTFASPPHVIRNSVALGAPVRSGTIAREEAAHLAPFAAHLRSAVQFGSDGPRRERTRRATRRRVRANAPPRTNRGPPARPRGETAGAPFVVPLRGDSAKLRTATPLRRDAVRGDAAPTGLSPAGECRNRAVSTIARVRFRFHALVRILGRCERRKRIGCSPSCACAARLGVAPNHVWRENLKFLND